MAASGEKQWYDGSCHCRAVKFKILIPPITGPNPDSVVKCTCSLCTANGYMFVYPARNEAEWIEGYETLKEYRVFSKLRCHKFCGNCGSSVMVDMNGHHPHGDVLAFNVRMLRAVPLDDLNIENVDGRNLIQPEYNDAFQK